MQASNNVNAASGRRDETAVTRSADRQTVEREGEGPAFADLFGSVQAMFGTRIGAMVGSIVPDGRGLSASEPGAHDERLAELSEDVRQARQQRREAQQTNTADEPTGDRPRETGRARAESLPVVDRSGHAEASSAGPDRFRRVGDVDRRPVAMNAPAAPESTPMRQAPGADTNGGRTVSPPQAASRTQAVEPSPPTGVVELSAPVASDGGTPARQLGELLGARVAGEGGRATSGTQVSPVAAVGGDRQDATGAGRATVRTDRPPSRPEQAKEAPAAQQTTFDRLVRSIRTNQGRHESTARLQLEPPDLGRVRIDVRLVNQRMQLSIQTETRDARDVLGSRLETLRSALAAHGVVIEKVDLPAPSSNADPNALVWQDDGTRRRDSQDVADAEGQEGDSGGVYDLSQDEESALDRTEQEPALAGASSDRDVRRERLDIRI